MLIGFSPFFVADTKIIYGYNFVAPLTNTNWLMLFNKTIWVPTFRKSIKNCFVMRDIILKSVNRCTNQSATFRIFLIFNSSEAVVRRCSVKKMFLEISQNSQENSCARDSVLITLQALCQILFFKSLSHRCFPVSFAKFLRTSLFYTTPPVAASAFPEDTRCHMSLVRLLNL